MNPWKVIEQCYRKYCSKPLKITFCSACITGILAHLFALTNVINNYDSITQIPKGVGTTLPSGRWLLMLIEKLQNWLWDTYSVPFWNGLISILLLAVTACVVTNIFQIQNTLNCILTGAIMVVFPAITSMMFFMYTAPHYSLAILLSVLAVYFSNKKWLGSLIAVVCCVCALGIYQAYLPLTVGLMVTFLLWKMLRNEADWKTTILRGIKYLILLAGSLWVYMKILNAMMAHYGIGLSNYQGVNHMGKLSLQQIPLLLKKVYRIFFHLSNENYYGMNSTIIVQRSIWFLGILSVVAAVYFWIAYRRKFIERLMIVVLFMMIPVAVGSIEIMCSESKIYTLMIYGMVVVYLIPILLLELWEDRKLAATAISVWHKKWSHYLRGITAWGISIFLLLISVNYIWSSNVNYTLTYYATLETQEYLASMMTRMRDTEGYSPFAPVAFIGKDVQDPTYDNVWGGTPVTYGGTGSNFVNSYSRNRFFNHLLSYNYIQAEPAQIETLKQTKEVKDMPCYPSDGSIKMIDGTLVVKLSND